MTFLNRSLFIFSIFIISLFVLGTQIASVAEACQSLRFDSELMLEEETSVAVVKGSSGPSVMDEGYIASTNRAPVLWFKLRAVPENAHYVLLESVWGTGPYWMKSFWSKKVEIRNGMVAISPQLLGRRIRDQSFTLGLRLRYLFEDGSTGEFSLPTFINHSGRANQQSYAGFGIFLFCSIALLGLWSVYWKEVKALSKIRVATLMALVSLLFLCLVPALSWTKVTTPWEESNTMDCRLGDEVQCATYDNDGLPNPVEVTEVSAERHSELLEWVSVSSALRLGIILTLFLLLPTLIWLLVIPSLRWAQSAVAFGASAASFTLLGAIFYRFTMPSWMPAETMYAFELTILTTVHLIVCAGLIVLWSLRMPEEVEVVAELPKARSL